MHSFVGASGRAISRLEKAETIILDKVGKADAVTLVPPPIGPTVVAEHRAQKGTLMLRWVFYQEFITQPPTVEAQVYLHFSSDTFVAVRYRASLDEWVIELEQIALSRDARRLASKWKPGPITESVAYEIIEHLAEYFEKYRPQQLRITAGP